MRNIVTILIPSAFGMSSVLVFIIVNLMNLYERAKKDDLSSRIQRFYYRLVYATGACFMSSIIAGISGLAAILFYAAWLIYISIVAFALAVTLIMIIIALTLYNWRR